MLYFVRRPPRCEIFRNEIRNGDGRNGNGNGRNVRCEASKILHNEAHPLKTKDLLQGRCGKILLEIPIKLPLQSQQSPIKSR